MPTTTVHRVYLVNQDIDVICLALERYVEGLVMHLADAEAVHPDEVPGARVRYGTKKKPTEIDV